MSERGFGHGPGRRENIIIVTEKDMELLRDKGVISEHAAYVTDKTPAPIFLDHDLLVNWFFIIKAAVQLSVRMNKLPVKRGAIPHPIQAQKLMTPSSTPKLVNPKIFTTKDGIRAGPQEYPLQDFL